MPDHLYLTGYRGTGKTAVGSVLAERLQRPLVDVDAEVQSNSGKTIREIFESGSEESFRNLESIAIEEIAKRPPHVVSLGGGAILREVNRNAINASGRCVWLTADVDTIVSRIHQDSTSADQRPSLTRLSERDEISSLLETRRDFYAAVADFQIDTTTKSVDQIADEIAQWFLALSSH